MNDLKFASRPNVASLQLVRACARQKEMVALPVRSLLQEQANWAMLLPGWKSVVRFQLLFRPTDSRLRWGQTHHPPAAEEHERKCMNDHTPILRSLAKRISSLVQRL